MVDDADIRLDGPHEFADSAGDAAARYSRESEPPETLDESSAADSDELAWLGDEDPTSEISADDIQAAYLKALMAMEAVEWPSETRPEIPVQGEDLAEPAPPIETKASAASADAQESFAAESPDAATLPALGQGSDASAGEPVPQGDVAASSQVSPVAATAPSAPEPPRDVSPLRIIESILFVGGNPITSRRLCGVLSGNIDHEFVEQRIAELNAEYLKEGRPYEIRLGDGGYRMSLLPEFEPVRNRVFGAGPREIRLSQDALEVLALVAYQQPLSHDEAEACGKKNVGNLLRQLIRRELVAIHRVDATRTGIRYQTTPRFLSLFGLANLSELPQADDLNLR